VVTRDVLVRVVNLFFIKSR